MLPFELTKDTPYLALLGELWNVFYELNRNWSCYKGFLLYIYIYILDMVLKNANIRLQLHLSGANKLGLYVSGQTYWWTDRWMDTWKDNTHWHCRKLQIPYSRYCIFKGRKNDEILNLHFNLTYKVGTCIILFWHRWTPKQNNAGLSYQDISLNSLWPRTTSGDGTKLLPEPMLTDHH